jgi:hypothetical protein
MPTLVKLGAIHLGKYLRFSWERVVLLLGLERPLTESRKSEQVKTVESKLHSNGGTHSKNGSLFS